MLRARLTCRRARPGLLSSESRPAGEGADSPNLPACRPPRRSPQWSPAARRRVLERRATGAPPTLAPRSFSPFSFPRASRAWSLAPRPHPQVPDALAERAATERREGRRPPPGAWSARGPGAARAARGLTEQRAAPGLGWLRSARGRQRMLAGFLGLSPRSRRGGPRVRP